MLRMSSIARIGPNAASIIVNVRINHTSAFSNRATYLYRVHPCLIQNILLFFCIFHEFPPLTVNISVFSTNYI